MAHVGIRVVSAAGAVIMAAVALSGCAQTPSDPKVAYAIEVFNGFQNGNPPLSCKGLEFTSGIKGHKYTLDTETPAVIATPPPGFDPDYGVTLPVKSESGAPATVTVTVTAQGDGWCATAVYGF